MTRTLNIEPLEARQLLSASPWPSDQGYAGNVFNDAGVRLSNLYLPAAKSLDLEVRNLVTSSATETRNAIKGTPSDTNGELLYPDGQPRYQVLFANGGKSDHSAYLHKAGRQNVRDFVAAGGSYTGSCAGAFMADDYASFTFGLWPGYMGCCGPNGGSQTVRFEDTDHPFVKTLLERNNGSNVVHGISHYGGPIFREQWPHPGGTQFLGTIVSGFATGSDQIIDYKPSEDSGRVVIQPNHPEYAQSGSRLALMETILLYAMDGAKDVPDLKGELAINESITMNGADERIGDEQYHRYTIDVPEGTETLSIELDGKAKLFVQHELYAHADSTLTTRRKAFSIDDPQPGTWHVSVYGNHTVPNGTPYTLSVTDEPIVLPPPFGPIYETFSDGLPDENWTYYSTGAGVIDASSGRMEMYSATPRIYSLNEAILGVETGGHTGLILSFDQYWMKDEYHSLPGIHTGHVNADGVSLSVDGLTWHKLPHKNGSRRIALDEFFGQLGLDYSSGLQVKFQQYDNWTRDHDGRGWDNITID